MTGSPRLATWRLPPGPVGDITDVPGVRVGHAGVRDEARGVATGVSVIVPPGVEVEPLPAATHVINGFGKSVGLMQVDELGTLESPIVLTGVFSVPTVHAALLQRRLAHDPTVGDGPTGRSVNLVVLECNDSHLSDPRAHLSGEVELAAAFDDALADGDADDVGGAAVGPAAQGTVGAGTGMRTFGLSGGFGSASRVIELGSERHVVGVALVSNFGRWGDLTVGGRPVQPAAQAPPDVEPLDVEPLDVEPLDGRPVAVDPLDGEPPGSVVVVLATDLPYGSATLRRLAVRVQSGLARTGCVTTHGSGELVVAFSTSRGSLPEVGLDTETLDLAFRAVAEATEEAVLSGLTHAEPVIGREGRRLPLLRELVLEGHGG